MTAQRKPQDGNPGPQPRKSRKGLWMFLGAVLCFVGVLTFLLSYSNNPMGTNIGVFLAVVGGLTAVINALRGDKARHQDTNGTGV